MISVMIRRWLRALLGWDEIESHLGAQGSRLAVLVDRVDDHERRIQVVAYKRASAPAKQSDLDWEAQQQAFLNNPDNFKEVN